MTKIKYIHCFGTSYTSGGGFEFESIHKKHMIELYKHTNQELSNYNFSYPGQLQNLVGDDVKVFNHAKPGFGDSTLYRLVFELTQKHNFKIEENLFIIENSGLGRDELFFNDINDFIVINYRLNDKLKKFEFIGSAKDYYHQFKNEEYLINQNELFFSNLISKFKNPQVETDKIDREITFFISWLETKKINYIFTSQTLSENEKVIEFGDGNFFKKEKCFVKFAGENKLLIKDETKEAVSDSHIGLKGLTLIALIIYNFLIEKKFINKQKLNIDWEYFSNLDYFKN